MSEALARELRAAREAAALFVHDNRAVIEVTGGDRERWLDGMISNEVKGLAPEGPRSGCYATVLTPKGRIIADLHVLARPDAYWLDIEASALEAVMARLDRYIIADDVALADRSADFVRLGIEGPQAFAWLEAAGARGPWPARNQLCELQVGAVDVDLVGAAFGWTGEPAMQLFVPRAHGDAVVQALLAAAPDERFARASGEALEVLRIEAGVPRQGAELDEEVFPAEARLEYAISTTKGCYTGQEIVARLRSRGHVNHILVSLRFDGAPLAPDTELWSGEKKTGEVTSSSRSPAGGAIGLGYVRVEHSEPGTELRAGDAVVHVEEPGFARDVS